LTRNPEELPGKRRDFFAYHNDRVDYPVITYLAVKPISLLPGSKYLIG
jgi:hypothetical protein